MGEIHFNINLKIPDGIGNIRKSYVTIKEKTCKKIHDYISKESLKVLNNTIKSKAHSVSHKTLSTIVSALKVTGIKISDTIRDFFDKSPLVGEISQKIGIDSEKFSNYPRELQVFLVSNLKDCCDESATDTIKMLKNILDAFEEYKHNKNISVSGEETKAFLAGIKEEIEELGDEHQKELNLYNELLLKKELSSKTKLTKSEKALAISKLFGGKEISSTKHLTINNEKVEVKTQNIPQKLLSGFPESTDLQQYSSEFQGETTKHATNLWKQDISLRDKTISFIRSGNTRGCEGPAKEILANALLLNYPKDVIISRNNSKENPLTLNFSNVQLMTPGKMTSGNITDKNMPLKQMELFKKLAGDKQQPIKLNCMGKDVYVKLEEPLVFNFPTNAQGFCKIFQPFTNFKKVDDMNISSFKNLFGDLEIFGGKYKLPEGHFIFNENCIVGKKLKDEKLDKNIKEQIASLSHQIINIYSKNKHGIEENPYALPSRVALLTNLLGYATSYGCKSGKDRTGVMSMELENLTAKVLSTNEPYDLYDPSDEEKENLKSIYKSEDAIKIAKINTGNVQNKLKIHQFGGLFKSDQKRFGVALSRDFNENLEKL